MGSLSGAINWLSSVATPSVASENVRAAIAATLVKRHCSSFVVGNPSRSNSAIALSRTWVSQAGCAGPCETERRYSAP
jgi:hypothetical protein